MNKKLKPCPFCGGKAKLYKQKFGDKKLFEVACKNKDCTYVISEKKTKQEAIKAWNTRHDPDVVAKFATGEVFIGEDQNKYLVYTKETERAFNKLEVGETYEVIIRRVEK